jgi:hypothetical protein
LGPLHLVGLTAVSEECAVGVLGSWAKSGQSGSTLLGQLRNMARSRW